MAASSARRTRQETRKLAAVLVTDVVGYSRARGTGRGSHPCAVARLRSDSIDSTIAVHHGRIFKRTGDGSRIELRSVVDAVRQLRRGICPSSTLRHRMAERPPSIATSSSRVQAARAPSREVQRVPILRKGDQI
jgi:class 3 adenylate cyclase